MCSTVSFRFETINHAFCYTPDGESDVAGVRYVDHVQSRRHIDPGRIQKIVSLSDQLDLVLYLRVPVHC